MYTFGHTSRADMDEVHHGSEVCGRRRVTETLTHFIGGVRADRPAAGVSLDPSDTRDVVAHMPCAEPSDMDAAVQAPRAAFPAWSGASPEVRADVLDRAGALILERREILGRLLAREEGKTLAEAIGEA